MIRRTLELDTDELRTALVLGLVRMGRLGADEIERDGFRARMVLHSPRHDRHEVTVWLEPEPDDPEQRRARKLI